MAPFWNIWCKLIPYLKFRSWKDTSKDNWKHTQMMSILWSWDWDEEGQFYSLRKIRINYIESENFLSCYSCLSHLSLVELHRCTKIQKDHQKIEHIHFTDYDPISASGWQRKHDFQLVSLTRLLLRITKWRHLGLERQQRDRCSLVLTAHPKWSCLTLPAISIIADLSSLFTLSGWGHSLHQGCFTSTFCVVP